MKSASVNRSLPVQLSTRPEDRSPPHMSSDLNPSSSNSRFDSHSLPVDGEIDPRKLSENTVQLLGRRKGKRRYIPERELARGGMGIINLVYDQDLRRSSAMKVISNAIMSDERRMKAFVAEARITAKLEHPNIVPVHEIGVQKDTGQPFYVMKMVEGEALDDIIYKIHIRKPEYVRKFNRHALLDIFRKVCYAIAFAHSRGIIHRDIKPENIMVGDYGEVLLMDWGLAKFLEEPDSQTYLSAIGNDTSINFEQTQDGVVKGSLAYISPEQAFGELSEVDSRTDIFLLGATLYQLLTHYPPYDADSVQEILHKAETCDYPAPSARNPSAQIPLALERIILKAMAPLKENRYLSVNEMIEDLDAFIAGKRVGGRQIFAAGEDLIRFGDESRETYVIISGKVDVFRVEDNRQIRIASLGKGEIIGEMAGITHKTRSATVTAAETTEVLVISHDLMLEELEKLPPWMEKIVFSLADRVQTLDQQLHPFLLTNCSYYVLNQLYLIFSEASTQGIPLDHVRLSRASVMTEISINIGVDPEHIIPIFSVLESANILALTDEGHSYLPKPELIGKFVRYMRLASNIKGGLYDNQGVELTSEQDAYFRSLARKLREIPLR